MKSVNDELDVYESADDIPSLQGEGSTDRRSAGHWSPRTRVMVTLAGGGLTAYGLRHKGPRALAASAAGAALMARGLINRSLSRRNGRDDLETEAIPVAPEATAWG